MTHVDQQQQPNGAAASTPPIWRLVALDHVQLAMPAGGEEAARRFYADTLGMAEIPKPARLAARGGCWFAAGAIQIHLGAELDFRAARKAHPALVVENLDALLGAVAAAWPMQPVWSEEIPGTRRCHLDDPFGNRLELIDARPVGGPPVSQREDRQ